MLLHEWCRCSVMQYPKSKKLNAVKQLTAMITPPSTVNMMSNDEDHCFQCQEQGHIARNCPNIRCFKCDEYGYIVMDCPHRIPPLGTLAKHHQPKSHKSHHTRSSSRQCHEDRDRRSHSRSQSHFYRQCSSSHHDSYRGHSRSWPRDNCQHPRSSSQCLSSTYRGYSHWSHRDTSHQPHHRSSAHRSSSLYHCRDWNHSHSCPSTNPQDMVCIGHTHTLVDYKTNHITRRTPESIKKIHAWINYSSDDHSNNSGEEMDHLN